MPHPIIQHPFAPLTLLSHLLSRSFPDHSAALIHFCAPPGLRKMNPDSANHHIIAYQGTTKLIKYLSSHVLTLSLVYSSFIFTLSCLLPALFYHTNFIHLFPFPNPNPNH